MRIVAAVLGLALATMPVSAHGKRHGPSVRHGHPINSWMGSRRLHLR